MSGYKLWIYDECTHGTGNLLVNYGCRWVVIQDGKRLFYCKTRKDAREQVKAINGESPA